MTDEKMCPLFTIAKAAMNSNRDIEEPLAQAYLKENCAWWYKRECSAVGIACALENLTVEAIETNWGAKFKS